MRKLSRRVLLYRSQQLSTNFWCGGAAYRIASELPFAMWTSLWKRSKYSPRIFSTRRLHCRRSSVSSHDSRMKLQCWRLQAYLDFLDLEEFFFILPMLQIH